MTEQLIDSWTEIPERQVKSTPSVECLNVGEAVSPCLVASVICALMHHPLFKMPKGLPTSTFSDQLPTPFTLTWISQLFKNACYPLFGVLAALIRPRHETNLWLSLVGLCSRHQAPVAIQLSLVGLVSYEVLFQQTRRREMALAGTGGTFCCIVGRASRSRRRIKRAAQSRYRRRLELRVPGQ